MMFAFALLWMAQVPVAEPPAITSEEPEIVVIARKLKIWHGEVVQRKGKAVCKIKRSTGEKEIDQIGCDALLQCTARRSDDINAINAANKDRRTRKRLMEPVVASIRACALVEMRNAGIAAAAKRRAARGEK